MDSDVHRAKVQAHKAEAERRQVAQTPTFIIGGKMIPGAIPYDEFKRLVDEAAKNAPPPSAPAASAPAPTGSKVGVIGSEPSKRSP